MAELVLTRVAREDASRLPEGIRHGVVATLDRLAVKPRGFGKPLLGRLRGRWSARVGTYRIVYTIEGPADRERVIVRAIKHRAVAYGRHRGR